MSALRPDRTTTSSSWRLATASRSHGRSPGGIVRTPTTVVPQRHARSCSDRLLRPCTTGIILELLGDSLTQHAKARCLRFRVAVCRHRCFKRRRAGLAAGREDVPTMASTSHLQPTSHRRPPAAESTYLARLACGSQAAHPVSGLGSCTLCLPPFGGHGPCLRRDELSSSTANGEHSEPRTLASCMPSMFLACDPLITCWLAIDARRIRLPRRCRMPPLRPSPLPSSHRCGCRCGIGRVAEEVSRHDQTCASVFVVASLCRFTCCNMYI